jgi:hypothetical protein
MQTELAIISQPSEALTARQWGSLLGITAKAFQLRRIPIAGRIRLQGGLTNIYAFADLSDDDRTDLDKKRLDNRCLKFVDLLDVVDHDARARINLKNISSGRKTGFAQFSADAQQIAHLRMKAMSVYYEALARGVLEKNANALACQTWEAEARTMKTADDGPLSITMRTCCYKKIQRLARKLRKFGDANAPIEAYLDGKSCAHANARRQLPHSLEKDFKSRMTESRYGVPSVAVIHRDYCAAWDAGCEIPGLGCRTVEGEPFPVTISQLQRVAPARAVREIAGRGKFSAKTKALLAAPPLDWSQVEPMRVVMFDDKVLDCMVLTDDGLRAFRPVIYFAYCAGTGRVLAYVCREEGRMTQLDVEGLEAAVLREHGFHEPSIWVRERGTVSMTRLRKDFLERLFHPHLVIHPTMMIGGANALGDWKQAGKGNFFGKGRLEAACGAFDWIMHTIPAQTGNAYQEQPAMLGDTTLTLQNIINSARRDRNGEWAKRRNGAGGTRCPQRVGSGSLLEESILTAAMSRVIAWTESHENLTAYEAALQTGIKPPILYYSDFVALLGELFRRFNNRRGHAMQGFDRIRVPHPNNAPVPVGEADSFPHTQFLTESPNDKAARMFETMNLQGRKIRRPTDENIGLLLHKLARVTVNANGAVCSHGPQGRSIRYWHEHSRAQHDARSVTGGKKVFLALYNPIAPDALYLLANPPGHINASATELPKNFKPQLYEVLPRYVGPDPTNPDAMHERSARVQEFNAPLARAVAVYSEPRLLAQSQKRKQLKDRLEPLRSTVMSARPQVAPEPTDFGSLGADVAAAERVILDSLAAPEPGEGGSSSSSSSSSSKPTNIADIDDFL